MEMEITSSGCKMRLSLDKQAVAETLEQFRHIVEETITKQIQELSSTLPPTPAAATKPEAPPNENVAVTGGVVVTRRQQLEAADFRTALLHGRLPDDSGLLIDTKELAGLLNIGSRTLWRLTQMRAVPAPVHLGRMVRWRLAEVLAWIEADCPPQREWTWGETPKKPGKKS